MTSTRLHWQLMSLPERFAAQIVPDQASGCWRWIGAHVRGRGKLRQNNRERLATHVAWNLHRGEIPEGMVLDHLCRNVACVNPDHLEPVTQSENLRRGDTGARLRAVMHCPSGHAYDAANTYVDKRGKRYCRACSNLRRKRYPRLREMPR